MHTPRTLAAALFSAAILLTSGIAYAGGDKHDGGHKGPDKAMSVPGNVGEGQSHNALTPSGAGRDENPGRMGNPGRADGENPMNSPGRTNADRDRTDGNDIDRSAKSKWNRGSAAGFNGSSDDVVQSKLVIKMRNGEAAQFDVDQRMSQMIQARGQHKNLIFYSSDGRAVTSISAVGERCHGQVIGTSANSVLFRSDDGQTRILSFGTSGAKLHLRTGSKITVETEDATHARVISDELLKKHEFDKFDKRAMADVDTKVKKAKKTDVDVADVDTKIKKAKKTDVDVADVDTKVKKAKKTDVEVADIDTKSKKTKKKTDQDVADVDTKVKKAKKTDVDVADIDTKAKKTKKKTDQDVADVDTASDKGAKSKCGESTRGGHGRAFANQMGKDAANDASGHNPPGLPHECINPAGHTRGFCKQRSSEVDCSGSASSDTDNDVASADIDNGHSGKGKCGESTASHGGRGRAFANQMAKDAANDASGHNPPGLPHECINPAGHTRGFCKQRSSDTENDCASASSGGTVAVNTPGLVTSNVPNNTAAPNAAPNVPHNGNLPVAGGAPVNVRVPGPHGVPPFTGGGPGTIAGTTPALLPAGGTGVSSAARGASPKTVAVAPAAARAKHPTRVMGAAVGPESIQLVPLSKTPCVWHRTAVMGAAVGPYARVGRSYASGSHIHRHSNCR